MNAEHIKSILIKWLLDGNLSFNQERDAIGVEVLFSKKRRKADILILSRYLHAIEIKGDYDNLKKLSEQLNDYHKTFDKVTVATTLKHIQKIKKIIKPSTGLILIENNFIRMIKPAQKQSRLDKQSLLMFLSKNELANLLKIKNRGKLLTNQIRNVAIQKLPIKEIRKAAYSYLKKRHKPLFWYFLDDICGNIPIDELRSLTGKINKLSI